MWGQTAKQWRLSFFNNSQINCIFYFQLSFILQSLRHPDVFCFADYLTDVVVCDILKSAPSDDDREVSTWWDVCVNVHLYIAVQLHVDSAGCSCSCLSWLVRYGEIAVSADYIDYMHGDCLLHVRNPPCCCLLILVCGQTCMLSVTGICLWWGNGETWFLYICVDTENVCGFQEIVELGGDVVAPVWLGSLPACLWSIQTTHEQVSRCLGARSAADLCKCSPLVHSLCLCICLPVSSSLSLSLACSVFVRSRS